jgi:alkylation response protein AidB-like acyl-CoA dehydrogenase
VSPAAAVAARFEPSGIIEPLLDSIERFCRTEVSAVEIDHSGRIPPHVLAGLAELGLFGLTLPDAYGGAELSLRQACRAIAALARFDRSVATTVGLHLGLGTRALVAYGSPKLKARYLPELSCGDLIAAFATTEPNAGSDLSSLSTHATPEGNALVVEGRKLFVTNGGIAKLFTLTVSTPGLGGARRGTSLMLIEGRDAGLSVGREEHKLGLRGSSTTSLTLDGVRVGPDRIIGEPGQGGEQLPHVLAWGRTLMSAGCCGTGRTALSRALEHTSARRQFGKPLSGQPVVQEQLASMMARLFAMEALANDAAALEDDLPALLSRSVAAKVFCSEGASFIVDTALQLHGGMGFIDETGLSLLLRDVRITRIFEGANDVLLSQLGAGAATAPRPREKLSGRVALHAEAVAAQADALAEGLAAGRAAMAAQHRIALLQRSRLLHRLGRAHVWLEALDAAVRSASAMGPSSVAAAELIADSAVAEVAEALAEPIDDATLSAVLAGARA